jgi:type IV secretion system protein TrbL
MNDIGVIDHFLNVFTTYIDSGFGLLRGEVHYLTATLVAIDIALAGLFWALGGTDDIIAKLIKKVLYVGAFAFIIANFNGLSTIVFKSFAGLGLTASGSGLTAGDLLRPGRLASVGVDAARPIMYQISELSGFPEVFLNIDSVSVLFVAWLVVIVSFFFLAVQLFVTLIEFKLTTLAGFVLVPFALWNKTAFLAERVLGNVVSSGIKVLVLAVIVGIGTGIFGEFTAPLGADPSIDQALAIMLASLALFGLGIFGPGIAAGLISGAPQLGAGAMAGTVIAAGELGTAGAGLVRGTARMATASAGGAVRGGMAGYEAYRAGVAASGRTGAASIGPGLAGMARASGSAMSQRARQAFSNFVRGSTAEADGATGAPSWAQRMRRQNRSQGAMSTAQTVRGADHGGSGPTPNLTKED